ncbi:hypothetical protein LWI28_012484 [Acer negundo]|uniref:Multiple myeloma tumor-associated protein 2-like N-terminal domain-containing protein n=1 Tax=Acer negundo TaxID=4023 RepID=A0AAD5NDY4_ACENE|nr:hypothetical protein LWI28_012484 [Acer negundo]
MQNKQIELRIKEEACRSWSSKEQKWQQVKEGNSFSTGWSSSRLFGVRGGRDQFSRDDVKVDKHCENFLGHSIKAPMGRWQKGAIPLEIGSLKNLVSLYLSGNNLIGPIPSTLGRLTKLRDLDLRKNSLVGPIPSTLGHLIQLKTLYLLVGLCGQVLALHIQNLNPIQPMIGKINLKM